MKKKNKKRIIILGITAVFILVLFLGTAEYTSHSKFCSSCHYMKPFYQSWKTSSHNKVECATCHYPPGLKSKIRAKIEGILQVGRYWTKLYLKSKPWAEIPDESCLQKGCHAKRLLEGKVRFKKVVFDHKIHLTDLRRGKRLRCTSCHSQIVQGKHITVTESTCFICHFKKSEHYPRIADCSHCHQKQDLISEKTSRFNHNLVFKNGLSCQKCHSHVIVGDGAVPKENCFKCHWERDRLAKYEDTDLIHSTHITSHKIECNLCHLQIQHKVVKEIEAIADCQTCHVDYHKAQKILFTGQGGKGVPHPVPNIMFEKGLSCKGCHIFHEEKGGRVMKSETFISRGKACESCHGQGFSRILKEWELATKKKLAEIRKIYVKANSIIKNSKNESKTVANNLLEQAAFNIDLVERGKSVHNMAYSQKLLDASYTKIKEALNSIKSTYKPPIFVAATKKIPTQCSNCHMGIEEITKEIYGLRFPHKKHFVAQNIKCNTCHSNAQKHGQLIATKKSCAPCHHQQPQKNCGRCHQLQAVFYQGGSLLNQTIPKDIMAEAGVECQDCHLNFQNKVFRPDEKKCLDCHQEEYGKTFKDWQQETKNNLYSLRASLKSEKNKPLSNQAKALISTIENMLNKIALDGSFGVHNYLYIEETINGFKKKLESVGKKNR